MNAPFKKQEMDASLQFLLREGEMRTRIREFDWSKTPLGAVTSWPSSLKTALSIMLDSATAAYIAWGPRFYQFYNDAYIPILGATKHPDALGKTSPETWEEIWDFVEPLFMQVLQSGQSVTMQNKMFPMMRSGYLEECYFTFSYSPLTDEHGDIQGTFATVWETTEEFVGHRRKNVLRLLAQELAKTEQLPDVYAAFEKTVRQCGSDLPFGLWYHREDSGEFKLVVAAGLESGSALSPGLIDPGADNLYAGLESFSRLITTTQHVDATLLRWSRTDIPLTPPQLMVIEPLCYDTCRQPDACIVLGANPMRPYDEEQTEFLDTIRFYLENALRRIIRLQLQRREQEYQFQAVMAVLPCLVWLSNTAQECIFVNESFLRFTGRSFEEEIGYGWLQRVHPDDIHRIKEIRAARAIGKYETFEFRLLDASNNFRWLLSSSVARYDINGTYVGDIGTCLDVTDRKSYEQVILASQKELHSLYDHLHTVREEERCALAREVHDQLGQVLSAAKIDIKLLEEEVGATARLSRKGIRAELASARHAIEKAIGIVRRLAFELRPPELESQGLAAAIQWHFRDFERRTRICCNLSLPAAPQEIDDAVALAVFGVFQEATTNILRHAQASQVWVALAYEAGQLRLEVRDDGIGMAGEQRGVLRTMGLKGMYERALSVGGKIQVLPAQPTGTQVIVTVPVNPRHALGPKL